MATYRTNAEGASVAARRSSRTPQPRGNMASGASSPGGEAAEAAHRSHHPRSFKLRFAAQREPGRSYVSPVQPRGLPATVAGKFYAASERHAEDEEQCARALQRIRDLFERGPRDLHARPRTSAHEVGWWWVEGLADAAEARSDRRRAHHLRDSAWLKARLLVLAADTSLKAR